MSARRGARPRKAAANTTPGEDKAADRAPPASGGVPAPELLCYPTEPEPPKIIPARAHRAWMDATNERFAYRCTPLSIANASGWELILPFSFDATWMGGADRSAILIHSHDGDPRCARLVTSHFGHGVLTFHTGWLFRTPPGWALWARGTPNASKRNVAPLEGLVETDWLPFTFTMNWRFTRMGTARFEKGEAFCFITLAPHGLLDAVQPRIMKLEDDPELNSAFQQWKGGRKDFNARLQQLEPAAVAQGWQRTYLQGKGAAEEKPQFHLSKRKLKAPR
ncbi:MAG: DUF6065 family protein [Roseiarcus sp.]